MPMASRKLLLAGAWCSLFLQAGCLQRPGGQPLFKAPVAAAAMLPQPNKLPVSQVDMLDNSSYALISFETEFVENVPQLVTPVSPAEALQRSMAVDFVPEPPKHAAPLPVGTQVVREPPLVITPAAEVVNDVQMVENVGHYAPAPVAARPTQAAAATPAPAPAANWSAASSRTLLNTTSMALNYRVNRVGPSGVGKVEVWISNDQGAAWQRLCEDIDRRTPSEIQLPGEGQWGVRLVAVNGNGFGGTAPRPGDQPSFCVEVDTTNPHVQLGAVEPVEGHMLDIRWTAQDANLGSGAVAIYYRTEPNQAWQLAADKLPNSGQYRWQFPRDQDQFFVRVQVRDEAGNSSTVESPTAVAVDMTVPQLIVVGVSGADKR